MFYPPVFMHFHCFSSIRLVRVDQCVYGQERDAVFLESEDLQTITKQLVERWNKEEQIATAHPSATVAASATVSVLASNASSQQGGLPSSVVNPPSSGTSQQGPLSASASATNQQRPVPSSATSQQSPVPLSAPSQQSRVPSSAPSQQSHVPSANSSATAKPKGRFSVGQRVIFTDASDGALRSAKGIVEFTPECYAQVGLVRFQATQGSLCCFACVPVLHVLRCARSLMSVVFFSSSSDCWGLTLSLHGFFYFRVYVQYPARTEHCIRRLVCLSG